MLEYLTCYTLGLCVLSTTGILDSYCFIVGWGRGAVLCIVGCFRACLGFINRMPEASSPTLLTLPRVPWGEGEGCKVRITIIHEFTLI